ncbi:MAG: LTA synthase family protein, partial [Candidatus Afipia apatlaquensis]|nr:LTA synthase family protein [Candidatus Afipia apatlaquensis]
MDTKNTLQHVPNCEVNTVLDKIRIMCLQNWETLLFLIIIVIKVLYYGKEIAPDYFVLKDLEPPVIASLLPFIAIAFLFRKKRRYYLVFINIVVSLILFADTVYYRYFKDIISIGGVRDSFLLKIVASSVGALIVPRDFIYLMDILILTPLVCKIKIIKNSSPTNYTLHSRVIIFILMFSLGVAWDGKYIYQLSKEQPLLITTMSNKIYLTKILGNINFHALDVFNFASNKVSSMQKMPENMKQDIQAFFNKKNQNKSKNLYGSEAGKNLIVIQVEALQQFVINSKINGQEITPNLNRWIGKSLYFDNYFYQVSEGNTSDAEFMSNNSLYPAASGAAYYRYPTDTLDSLPQELKNKGYYT